MKNSIFKIFLVGLTLPILTGCMTTRTATYPDDDYDTVFKRTVKNLCSDPDLLVYEADKSNGVIKVQGRQALFVNPPVGTQLNIKGAKGETPVTADITMPGMSNIWADKLISATAGPATQAKKEIIKSEVMDSVYLKNGTVVKGKITEDTNEYVIVEHDNKWEKINRADIEKIIRN